MAILRHGGEQYVTPENILYPDVMEYLKQCAQGMVLMNKYVVMAFCEYKLSDVFPSSHKPAEELPPNFIVVCIRFIKDGIYQPIGTLFLYNDEFNGYSPSEKELADCLRLYILAVSRLSFKVVATVSPPTYTFKKALKELTGIPDITTYNGPLMYSVAEVRDIVHIFDPPSLLKGFRNLFMDWDIEYKMNNNTFCASWKDIETLHDKGGLRFLQKEHISPGRKVLHPNFAAELFNNKVSSAIAQAVKFGSLSKNAMGTSILVKMFSDLFDSFNSVSADKNNASSHMLLWDKVLKCLDSITFLDGNLNTEPDYYPLEDSDPGDSLCGSNWKYLQDFSALDMNLTAQINVIEKVKDENAQKFADEASQKLKNEASQTLEDEASQKLEDEASQKLEDEASQKLEGEASQKLEDEASQKLKCEDSQKLKDEASQKLKDEALQGRLRVVSDDLLYKTSLEDDKRSSDTLETKSDVETSNMLNEKLEDEMKQVDGKIEIPLLKCTADIRLASDQNEVTNSSKTVKTQTIEKLKNYLRDRDSTAADKNELLKNSPSDKNYVESPSCIKEGSSHSFDENKREKNTEDSFLGNSKAYEYIDLRRFMKNSADSDVKYCYGYIEESRPGRDDKNESTPLLCKENKANYKSTAICNTNSSKQNESCKNKHDNSELKSTIEKVVQEKIHHSEFDHNKVFANVRNDVDEFIPEKCLLNNTIDKDKSSNDSVKNLNMYTENDTNINKNEVNTLNDKTEVKVVNVKNHINYKVKEGKSIEDSITSSLGEQISHLNIVGNMSPKSETNLNHFDNLKNDHQKTVKENKLDIQKEDQSSETNYARPILDSNNDVMERFQIPEAMKKIVMNDENLKNVPVLNSPSTEVETPGFESDSETDHMPSIPINDILRKLEAPEKKADDSENSEKALLLDQTATPQSLALNSTKRKHEIIRNWMTSVEGIQRMVKMLEGRGVRQINAKALCVDCIHDFINDARKSNEMNVSHQVSPNSPFKMLDEPHGILAMVRGSVVLLKS